MKRNKKQISIQTLIELYCLDVISQEELARWLNSVASLRRMKAPSHNADLDSTPTEQLQE